MGAKEKEEQVAFMTGITADGVPLLIMGVTRKAWEYMQDGKTHNFDLVKAGVPIRVMMFGAEDYKAAMKTIHEAAAAGGTAVMDEQNKDFNIDLPGGDDEAK